MDNLVTCTRCGSDACYTQEVNESVTLKLCYGCGFQTNSLMKEGEEFYQQQMEALPELYKDLATTDEDGLVWIPSHTHSPIQGMVYADGTSPDNWKWAAVRSKRLSKEETKKLRGKGKEAKYKTDMKTLKHFDERNYMDALSYIGLLP